MSDFLARSSDLVILLVVALVLVGVALGVAELAHRWVFGREAESEAHTKLIDLVHTSLFAFIAFMLAISVGDVRSNLGKADDAVSREAMYVATFDREIRQSDPVWAADTRAILRRYISAVAEDEWPRLAAPHPTQSPAAQKALDELRAAIRANPAGEAARATLLAHHDRLELARISRYENATRSIPRVFWLLIGGFLVGAMVLNGRYRPSALTRVLVAIHFTAIGMCVALILILDSPFRGETSIAPTPLIEAVGPG